MYAIAARFPIEARRYAAGLDYWSNSTPGARDPRPRTTDARRFCPLGACLNAMGIDTYHAPDPYRLYVDLGLSIDDPEHEIVFREALAFVVDWDKGNITDLADALGVS